MTDPRADPEIRALMDETLEAIGRGELRPERIEPWWEGRRENEQTPDYLGRVLDAAGLPEMAAKARMAHYDDFHAPADVADGFEIVRLVRDLRRAARATLGANGHPFPPSTRKLRQERFAVIENAARRGEFDATKAESDRWAASKDAQETFGELVRSAASAQKPGRNDPCWCGSGLKFKRCHGA